METENLDPLCKKNYVSEEQKKVLLDYINDHPKLKSGKFSPDFTYKDAQELWENFTIEVHKIPGATKTWQKWRKVR